MEVVYGFGFEWDPGLTAADIVDAVNSVQQSIKEKRNQRPDGMPYIVSVSISTHRVTWNNLGLWIDARLWRNPRFSWVSGILGYQPFRVGHPFGNYMNVNFHLNPNADYPVPDSFLRAVTLGEQFHWPRQVVTDPPPRA